MKQYVCLLAFALLLIACGSQQQESNPPAPPATQETEEEPALDPTLKIRGQRFDLVHGSIFSREDCASVWKCYFGTINDTLYAYPGQYVGTGCFDLVPVMCWKDTIPNLDKRTSYEFGAHAPCGKVKNKYRYALGFHLVGYVRIKDEQIYIVRHRMHGYYHPRTALLKDDPRWRGDHFREPEKTLVISSKLLLMGVGTNGVKLDVFPF